MHVRICLAPSVMLFGLLLILLTLGEEGWAVLLHALGWASAVIAFWPLILPDGFRRFCRYFVSLFD